MTWHVEFHPLFGEAAEKLPEIVQDSLFADMELLRDTGPLLGRPHVDTLNDSKYSNMKELRFDADNGVWRVAFAFDPERKAILLVAGDKSGSNQRRFYKRLIKRADERFSDHLQRLEEAGK